MTNYYTVNNDNWKLCVNLVLEKEPLLSSNICAKSLPSPAPSIDQDNRSDHV